MPEVVTLRAHRPAGFEELGDDIWRARLLEALRMAEATADAHRRETKRRVLGRKNVLRARPTDRPSSVEARRELRPCVACRNPEKRSYFLALLRKFRVEYRRARLRWCSGERHVVFPFGTYRLRASGVCCAPEGNALGSTV